MNSVTKDYSQDFDEQLLKIDMLAETPDIIRNQALASLRQTRKTIVSDAQARPIDNAVRLLENIKQESMKESFSTIYTQMCVLAVSSLEATLKSIFINRASRVENINLESAELEKIKVTMRELVDFDRTSETGLGELIVSRENLKFQDLKAIKRNFQKYLNIDPSLAQDIEWRISFYLESRHNIVHGGGVVDKKFLDATSSFGSNIKNYKLDERIDFDESDWGDMKKVFKMIVERLIEKGEK